MCTHTRLANKSTRKTQEHSREVLSVLSNPRQGYMSCEKYPLHWDLCTSLSPLHASVFCRRQPASLSSCQAARPPSPPLPLPSHRCERDCTLIFIKDPPATSASRKCTVCSETDDDDGTTLDSARPSACRRSRSLRRWRLSSQQAELSLSKKTPIRLV